MNKNRHKSFQPDFWKIVSLVLMVILAVFLLYPLITIGYKSLLNTEGQFTLSNYKDFFTLKYYTSALGHSFLVCSIATVFATLLSVDKPAQKKMMDNAKTMLNFIDSQLK